MKNGGRAERFSLPKGFVRGGTHRRFLRFFILYAGKRSVKKGTRRRFHAAVKGKEFVVPISDRRIEHVL